MITKLSICGCHSLLEVEKSRSFVRRKVAKIFQADAYVLQAQ